MREEMQVAQEKLLGLLKKKNITAGFYVRVHGKNLIVGRREKSGPRGKLIDDDRVRLSLLGKQTYGLSVMRHTGRWEKVPFTGTLEEVVDSMITFMQHLLMPYLS